MKTENYNYRKRIIWKYNNVGPGKGDLPLRNDMFPVHLLINWKTVCKCILLNYPYYRNRAERLLHKAAEILNTQFTPKIPLSKGGILEE